MILLISHQIRALFARDDVMVVATIPVQKHKSLKVIGELRDRDDVHILEVYGVVLLVEVCSSMCCSCIH